MSLLGLVGLGNVSAGALATMIGTPMAFSLILGALLLFADTGLYVAMWHRSAMSFARQQPFFNRGLSARQPYHELGNTMAHENDEAVTTVDWRSHSVDTLDRQAPHSYGAPMLHLEDNYSDCPQLRRADRLANTANGPAITAQQVLVDESVNYAICVVGGRLLY